jgi:hypothetical protein
VPICDICGRMPPVCAGVKSESSRTIFRPVVQLGKRRLRMFSSRCARRCGAESESFARKNWDPRPARKMKPMASKRVSVCTLRKPQTKLEKPRAWRYFAKAIGGGSRQNSRQTGPRRIARRSNPDSCILSSIRRLPTFYPAQFPVAPRVIAPALPARPSGPKTPQNGPQKLTGSGS